MKIKVWAGLFQKYRANVLSKKQILGFFPSKITVYYTPDGGNELAIFFKNMDPTKAPLL